MCREALEIGSINKPPVLYRENYTQWKIRFNQYVKKQPLGLQIINSLKNGPSQTIVSQIEEGQSSPKDPINYIDKERNLVEADDLAKGLLIPNIPNDILMNIDSYETAKEL
ncbi:DUF4219 domain-containing protein/UBN2 domain-containing protein [Artemisia annua]|uniref:DUF4219 domain-containing protein/UBN2 domain-containing protein n=1 Tax=Artemisia annua TaxID=35608 RepID=A0A2U1KK10_ARTAN|nr:DUF4219 domain-containing protein/UBN2 domain-containing protein [Artemisia annua]